MNIVDEGWDGGYALIHKNGKAVKVGDEIPGAMGQTWKIIGGEAPRQQGARGKVTLQSAMGFEMHGSPEFSETEWKRL